MSVTGSSPAKAALACCWLVFASVNAWLMYLLPGEETIPYHLIWASFALLYGFYRWSLRTTWITFSAVTVVTGIALVKHARASIIGWEECSEIVLMGVLVALLIWHVRRQQHAQLRLAELRESERVHAENREIAARFGSHEVRTRLTIARGFTELIRQRAADELTAADAAVVLGELDKASALATMLLTLVRVETPPLFQRFDLVELVGNVLTRWSGTAERNWSCDIAVGYMMGDPERMEAALDCLIENSVKFTAPGDAIGVRARVEGDQAIVEVTDSGPGIPESDRDRVSDIFRTGSTAGDRAGSGLGLAIVRAIVEARGGGLEVISTEGHGTTISMRMARANPAARSAAGDAGERHADPAITI